MVFEELCPSGKCQIDVGPQFDTQQDYQMLSRGVMPKPAQLESLKAAMQALRQRTTLPPWAELCTGPGVEVWVHPSAHVHGSSIIHSLAFQKSPTRESFNALAKYRTSRRRHHEKQVVVAVRFFARICCGHDTFRVALVDVYADPPTGKQHVDDKDFGQLWRATRDNFIQKGVALQLSDLCFSLARGEHESDLYFFPCLVTSDSRRQ